MAISSTLVDRVKVSLQSSGVGPFVLGPAVPAFRGVEALVDGATYSYAVSNGSTFECGQGVFTQGSGTLSRSPTSSSNNGGLVAFPASIPIVFTALAQDLIATSGDTALRGELASSGGAAMVGVSSGGTVESALSELGSSVSSVVSTVATQGEEIVLLEEAIGALDPREIAQTPRTLTTLISDRLPSLRIWDVAGYGPGSVSHNFDAENSFREVFGGSMGTTGDPIDDKYVDWAAGSDSNNGRAGTPYKTIQKALENTLGDVWLLSDSEEVLDFDGADRVAGSVARAMAIRGFNGRKVLRGAGLQPADVTWTESPPGGNVYTFTNTPGTRAEAIIYAEDGDWKNGVLIPFRGTASDGTDAFNKAGANFDGWSQVGTGGDVWLRFFSNMNIETEKAKFFIAYAATQHQIKGGVLLFENVDFVGGGGLQLLDSDVNPGSFKSTVFLRNCDIYFAALAGVDPAEDSFFAVQNCRINRNSGDAVGPHGTSVSFLVDSSFVFNGSQRTYFGVTNPARNRQGLSTHDASFAMAVGCDFQNNYGQNCANTSDSDTTITTHLIGCDLRNPWQGDGSRDYIIVGFTCLETFGKAYVDTCLAGGATSTIGWVVASGGGFAYRNQLQGTTAPSSSGISLFNPFGVLP